MTLIYGFEIFKFNSVHKNFKIHKSKIKIPKSKIKIPKFPDYFIKSYSPIIYLITVTFSLFFNGVLYISSLAILTYSLPEGNFWTISPEEVFLGCEELRRECESFWFERKEERTSRVENFSSFCCIFIIFYIKLILFWKIYFFNFLLNILYCKLYFFFFCIKYFIL